MTTKTKGRITIPVVGMHCALHVNRVEGPLKTVLARLYEVRWREDR